MRKGDRLIYKKKGAADALFQSELEYRVLYVDHEQIKIKVAIGLENRACGEYPLEWVNENFKLVTNK